MDEGDPMALECPLCCSKKFSSKTDLICHLGNYANSIKCSLCKKQYPTLLELIEHLRVDNCGLPHTSSLQTSFIQNSMKNLSTDDQSIAGNLDNDPLMTPKIENALENFKNSNATVTPSEIILSDLHADDPSEHIYEFFNKALAVGDYSEEKMKLVPGGNNDYVIVAQDSQDPLTLSAEGIVTKQNSDGTISINAIDKDGPKESDTVITMNEKDIDADMTDEIYNCNSCGMTFTSVLDHVQTYHKNQDVVVEVNEQGDDDNIKDDFSIEYDPGTQVDKNSQSPETNAMDFVTINEATKSIITQDGNIEETVGPIIHQSKGKSSKALFHQVVMKEMVTIDSGQKISVFYCNACHTYVTDLSEFKSHPCKMLSFTCTQCPASFETSKALQTHVKSHKTKKVDLAEKNLKSPMVYSNGGPFKCEICKTVFLTNKSLKLHKRMHDPLKLRPIEPPVDSHDGNTISSDEKYFCSICEKLIPLGYKSVHMEYHENLEVFNCDICNKKFTSNEYLTMHMNVHNLDKITETQKSDKDRPYSCLYCERKFARPHEKVKHERIHTGEKPHSCEICGKSFRVAYCLTLHMRTHTGARPYACLHCGKRFKAHSVYNHHLLTHSDVRAYKCPYCPKAFKTSVQLCGHKKSHTKPFSCKDCNRPFASLYAARRHAETHKRINNLKYSCTLCGASYARTFALKDHMKQAHKDEDAYVVDVNGEEKSVWGYFAQDQDKADDALDDVVTMGDGELPAVITSVGS